MKRDDFFTLVEDQLGKPVLWSAKGPLAFDCSGLVTWCLTGIGGPDLTHADNAQRLHDLTRLLGSTPTDVQIAGDLVFYGHSPTTIEHVAVVDQYGGVVSADGASSHITSLAVAIANPANRVRRHATIHYRLDTPYRVVHRNTLVDELDEVER